jgi:gluconate kinase
MHFISLQYTYNDPVNNKLLIIFGKPGAGKSYVAEILQKQFGYFSFNGDDALPADMKKKLFKKEKITDDMRDRFADHMIAMINTLISQHTYLVVHQTFLKEFMRKMLLEVFPDAQCILIECDDTVREQRYMKRGYFNLGLPYLRLMTDLFEPAGIPHKTINNNKNGTTDILNQLKLLKIIF